LLSCIFFIENTLQCNTSVFIYFCNSGKYFKIQQKIISFSDRDFNHTHYIHERLLLFYDT